MTTFAFSSLCIFIIYSTVRQWCFQVLNNIVKSYTGTLYENYSELLGLIENIESRARSGPHITKEQWQKLLSECMINHKIGSDLGCVIWVIYESEIKRLSIES